MLATMTRTPDGPEAAPVLRLWTPSGFRQDRWAHAENANGLSGGAKLILPAGALLALDPALRAASRGRLGVHLQPGEPLDLVTGLLEELSLVALAFPAFNDGRSFSKAELLRSRHTFGGSLRATGQVLIDQLPHMLRVGFDEFEVSHPLLVARLEKGETGGIPVHYQPSAAPAARPGKFSWRRAR
jgi:uncharacterized protein (DUF934 family)